MKTKGKSRLRSINSEWWLLLSMFFVSAVVVIVPFGGRLLLFLYLGPVMIAAFLHGRRQAVLTSVASVLMVVSGTFVRDLVMHNDVIASLTAERWGDLALWGSMVLAFGWGLGRLFGDVRQTNEGFLDILRHLVGRDNDRHNYVRRLSHFAGVIAQHAGLSPEECQTIRRAALLRDIGELELSKDTFKRFSTMCDEDDVQKNAGTPIVHAKLGEVMDLVLAEKIYGTKFDRQPMGSRVMAVATEYDDLTSTKKRRSALPSSVAKSMIERESGKRFDATVVRAFSRAYEQGAFTGTKSYAVAAGE